MLMAMECNFKIRRAHSLELFSWVFSKFVETKESSDEIGNILHFCYIHKRSYDRKMQKNVRIKYRAND